ncbi:MAG: MBG domain-containing protein [Chlorobiaceae bacterium]
MTILNDKIEQQPSRLHSLTLPISKQQSGMKKMVKRWCRKCRITTVAVIFSLLPEGRTFALPVEGLTAAGKAAITNPSSTDMHILQESRQAIINWNSFDISKNESVNITQPTCQSILLNRVLGNNPSHIFGTLTANGQIFLVNQNGVLFAPGASVNAGGVVASTLAIRDSDFLSEKYTLFKNGSAGSVINQGSINAGFTALLGSSAENTGSIIASKGMAGIAVGEGITLSFDPYGLVAIKVDQATYNAQIKNSGLIEADGGSVVMSASAADALLSTGVNNSGKVRAGTITEHNGKVSIEAGTISNSGSIEAGNNIDATAAGTMVNTGKFSAPVIHATVNNLLDAGLWDTGGYPTGGNIIVHACGSIEQTAASHIRADGNQGGLISITAGKKLYLSGGFRACGIAGQGGEIDITAPETIIAGTTASADGESGGGRIFIGGGWQGNDFTLANAATTLVTQSTRLNANALDNGNGGTVVIWSDQSTSFAGTIEARGGRNNGNGGEVEISSHDRLTFEGNVITAAPNGENGLLLLDPRNITLEVHPTTQTFYLTPLADANPEAGNQHGSGKIVELSNGNIIVATPSDDFAATNAGAVRLYKPDGTLLSILTGSTANDMAGYSLIALAGKNNAVTSTPNWSNSGLANAGAVTWIDGTTGISGNVSAANSLVGSLANDGIGLSVTALTNGHYVVGSPNWNNAAGAVTWGNGETAGNRLTGTISAANSLIGSSPNDAIGTNVTSLTNGNYVISSGYWDKVNADNSVVADAGAVTWCNGIGGSVGKVNETNSLVGSTKNDCIGSNDSGSNDVTALTNGNYVVCSGYWDNGKAINAGAVTWGDGLSGTVGAVSPENSLVGSKTGNQVGWGSAAVTPLKNGHYVVVSALWDNGTATNAGAVTWCNGLGGTVGPVSAANSLVGSSKNDYIGSDASASNNVKALTNGNYVVSSKYWDNGAVADVGAVIWGNGLGGTVGVITSSNSLTGSLSTDCIGSSVTALTNGNYVVSSPNWNNGAGAVTWGNGETGGARLVGTISADNSLTGSTPNDGIGTNVTALINGNYVTSSGYWDKVNADNSVVADAGAVTWCDGLGKTMGKVSDANSLIGSSKNDYAGSDDSGSNNVSALTNGNYVVSSKYWDNDRAVNAGAVTWCNGLGGTVGAISTTNSLAGSKTGNQVGSVTVMPNGDYVVTSPLWDNSSATNAGAVTLGSGTGGTVGAVTLLNSMVGSTKEDQVGSGGITPLSAGNMKGCFVVSSPAWLNNTGRVDIVTPLSLTQAYSSNPGTDNTFTPDEITSLLNGGSNLVLRANNDITVNSAILAGNQSTKSGDLSLHAGRSILVNASISTNNGNLTLAANDTAENGVVDTFRSPGSAVITMAPGTTINTGDGRIDIELRDGAGKTNRESGDITLRDITAGTINAVNYGAAAGSGITLASGTLAARASSGSSIVLVGRDFDNSTGGVLSTSGTARWLVYSESPGTTIKGGLTSEFRHYNGSSSNYAPDRVRESGNGFIYSSAPGTVSVSTTLAGGSASSVYGSTPTATYGFTLTSSDNEDTIGNIGLTGSMIVTGVPTATSNADSYTISYGGGLSSSIGLTFTAGTGLKYTVEKRAINISANALSKTYGDTDQTLTWMAEEQSMSRGLIPGDSFNGTLGRAAGENIGVYAINQGTLGNSNYAISYSGNNLTINPRPISFCATPTGRIYGESDPKLAVEITSGSLGSETVSDTLGDVTGILTRQSGSSVGSYDIALGSGRKAKNYAVTFETGNDAFSITKRPITITADDKSKTYSITDPKLTWQAETKSSGRGVLSGDSFSGTLERTAGENVGTYEITQGSLDNTNYAITLIGADFTINQRPITLHATVKSKIYGEDDPTLAVSISSGSLGSVTVSDRLSDVTGTLSRQSGSSVGSYDIALGSGAKVDNYAITFVTDNNAFSIKPRPITIAADDKSKVYGDADPALTWQAKASGSGRGLIPGDIFSGSLERAEGENAGTYLINQGTLGNNNYAISFTDANLTIDKRTPTLSIANAPVTINPPSGETLSNTVEPTTGTISRISGVQQASMHETGNANFNREFVRKTLSINAAPFVTTCDLPETSNGLWSEKLSATSGFVAVTSIEVHEPAMEFFIVPIPHGTFRHHNPEAILTLEVRLVNGLSLPAWMSFDPKLKVLSGTPPQEAKGEYPVELIAKDQFGGVARTVLLVKVG